MIAYQVRIAQSVELQPASSCILENREGSSQGARDQAFARCRWATEKPTLTPVHKRNLGCLTISVLRELRDRVELRRMAEGSPLGGPAVGMVAIVPAGLPQESRPGGGPTGSNKERVVWCCNEKLIGNTVQNNYLKV
jgi:hypothetical protein